MGRGAWNPGMEFKYQTDAIDPGQPEPLVVTYHDWAEDHEEAKIFHYRLLQDGKTTIAIRLGRRPSRKQLTQPARPSFWPGVQAAPNSGIR
ncbi:MAG: hypothetical protein DRO99_01275 [Candidatus Aenigmatarchaeota archaeon]|nr:MAG: hypothetical protein DRO99_01275 [Candidatus Aenigmarchaeota archaeon]